jgi:hypothetical protein
VRKNSKISAIRHHGGERRRLDDKSLHRYWRCTYYTGSATVLKVDGNCGGQTTYALAHLKNKHHIDCKADDEAVPSGLATFQATASAGSSAVATVATKAVREAYGLVTTFDETNFGFRGWREEIRSSRITTANYRPRSSLTLRTGMMTHA